MLGAGEPCFCKPEPHHRLTAEAAARNTRHYKACCSLRREDRSCCAGATCAVCVTAMSAPTVPATHREVSLLSQSTVAFPHFFFLLLLLLVSASCQFFFDLFCSHILGVDGNPFITACIQTNLAVSAVCLPHIRDPEANSINVWVAISMSWDSVFQLHA